jgi:hypothetical protein
MNYVLLYRDEKGQVQYLNKYFQSEAEIFEFAKVHHITEYQSLTETEFSTYMRQQQSQQQSGGYHQQVDAYSDEREPEPAPPRNMGYKNPMGFRPAFAQNIVFRPQFVGRSNKVRR